MSAKTNYRTPKPDDSGSESDYESDQDSVQEEDGLIQEIPAFAIPAFANLDIKQPKQKEIKPDINKALELFLKMKYFKNDAAVSGKFHKKHEDAVAAILEVAGFKKFQPVKKLTKKQIETLLINPTPNNALQIPIGCFIEQPLGSNNSPDFIVKISDTFILPIEAKSATGCCPLYNSGSVKRNYLYVFSSKKMNATTIYRGDSVLTLKQEKLLEEHIEKARIMDKEFNAKMATLDTNSRGICYYTRPMIGQKGKAALTNYFTHKDRKLAEQKACDWVNDKSSAVS